MAKPLALVDAVKLGKKNRAELERLQQVQKRIEERAASAEKRLGEANTSAFDDYLAPFVETFARLKNVDISDLPLVEAVPEIKSMNIELRTSGIKAVEALTTLASGAAAGAAAGGVTFAAVSTFAAASTGTAIASLSGAAATSATLAWLGGGSLAAGGAGMAGGTLVLTGIVAVPVLAILGGFLWWKGSKELRTQQQVEIDLKKGRSELNVQVRRAEVAIKRAKDTAQVVTGLARVGTARLPRFVELIADNDDYSSYSSEDRATVAEVAAIATTMSSVISSPILDDHGNVSGLSTEALEAGHSIVERLA